MTNKEMIFGLITTASTLAGVFGIKKALDADAKVERLCNRLGAALDDIENKTTFEISDEIVDEVVEDMARRRLDRVIPGKVQDAVNEIKSDAIEEIREEIDSKVNEAKPEIFGKLRDMVANVNINDLKAKAISEGAERAKNEVISEIRDEKDRMIDDIRGYEKQMENDIKDYVDDACEELQNGAEDKFDDALEDLTTRYKSRLDDIGSIYSSIANKMHI